jgi:lipopolysaccharide heptosyltransferase II
MHPIDLDSIRRVLIVKPSAIGDVAQTAPVATLLRRRMPEARIEWLLNKHYLPLLDGHPDIDEPIPFDRKLFASPMALVGRPLRGFLKDIRRRSFDLVLDLQGLFRSGVIARASGAPHRVGFANARELSPMFYTVKVPVPDPEVHAVDRYMSVLRRLGVEVPEALPWRLPVNESAKGFVDEATGEFAPSQDGPLVGVCPTTRWETKHWPLEYFIEVARRLVAERKARILIDGAPGDEPVTHRLRDAVNETVAASAVDLTGRTTLAELVAAIARADLFLTNDSGPMHIADALGTPLVAVFGPTNPVRTGPYRQRNHVVRLDIDCAPCYRRRCDRMRCMTELAPEVVYEKVVAVLGAE